MPRQLQIDVKGPSAEDPNIIECALLSRGYFRFYMSKSTYEALMDAGVFIRDGKEVDSAGVLNTTRPFIEQAF